MITTVLTDTTSVSLVSDKKRFKPYSELTIADDFMFGKLFQDRACLNRLLEILLHISPDESITEITAQRDFRVAPDRKRIITDITARSPTAEYDLEMQQQVHSDLPRRARYYQSIMDINFLHTKQEYTQLKKNYVMFICLRDPFKKRLPVYTFRNLCEEKPSVQLGDGTTKIFYNVRNYAKMHDKEVRAFMEYVSTNKATTAYTETLEDMVEDIRANQLWRKEYMDEMQENLLLQHEQERKERAAREEGIATGAQQARLDFAVKYKALGHSNEETADFFGLSLAEVERL